MKRLVKLLPLASLLAMTCAATTPNMSLSLPVPNSTPGPTWATMLNTALTTVDAHDHSTGKGLKVTPAGININQDMSFASFNLNTVKSARFANQSSALSGPSDIRSIYVYNNELYYNSSSGFPIQITSGSGLNPGSAGGFTGDYVAAGATALYTDVTKLYTFRRPDTTDANIKAANATFTGNETVAGTFGVTGASTLSGTLNVTGLTTVNALNAGSNVNVSGSFNVVGYSSTNSWFDVINAAPTLYWHDSTASQADFVAFIDANAWQLRTDPGSDGIFEVLAIHTTSSGAVGIQTATPSYALDVNGTLHASGLTQLDAAATVGGNLTVNGVANLTNGITSSGAMAHTGNIAVTGALTTSGAATLNSLGVTNNATVGGTLGVTGATSLSSLSTSGAATLNSLGVTNSATVGGTLGVTGNTSLSTVSTSGLATLNSASVTNNATVGGTLGVTGAATLSSNLNVAGSQSTTGYIFTASYLESGNTAASVIWRDTTPAQMDFQAYVESNSFQLRIDQNSDGVFETLGIYLDGVTNRVGFGGQSSPAYTVDITGTLNSTGNITSGGNIVATNIVGGGLFSPAVANSTQIGLSGTRFGQVWATDGYFMAGNNTPASEQDLHARNRYNATIVNAVITHTTNNTCALRSGTFSGRGVSSVSCNSAGLVTVNFPYAIDGSAAFLCTAKNPNGANTAATCTVESSASYPVTSVNVRTFNNLATLINYEFSLVVIGTTAINPL